MNILVTGGSSGLGASIVELLSKDHSVFFTYNSSVKDANKIIDSCKNTHKFKCDFRNEKSINEFINTIVEISPDVLINNAWVGFTKKHFHKFNADEIKNSFSDNIIPTLLITQACIKVMRKNKFGKIINILSNAIISPPIGWSEYSANKQYLLSMSNSWANENEKFNITSNCISPSFLLTNLTKDFDPRTIDIIKQGSPNGELLQTTDIAKMVYFLVNAPQHLNKINLKTL